MEVFCEFEKFLNEEISVDIKAILSRSGFDSKTAISCINNEFISEIEQYAKKNRSVLENTSY